MPSTSTIGAKSCARGRVVCADRGQTHGGQSHVRPLQRGQCRDQTRPFNQNDYVAWRYRWLDLDRDKIYDHPNEQGELIAVESAISDNTSVPGLGAGVKVLNHDLRQPKTNELSVHLERELMDSLSLRLATSTRNSSTATRR